MKKNLLYFVVGISSAMFLVLLVFGVVRLVNTDDEYVPSETVEIMVDAYMNSEEDFLNRNQSDPNYTFEATGNSVTVFAMEEDIMIVGSYNGEFTMLMFTYETTFFDNSIELGYKSYLGTYRDFEVEQESLWQTDNYIVVDMSEEEFITGVKNLTPQDVDYIASQIR